MTEQKVVAITGASSGIGAATAQLLAKRGMKVVLGSQGKERLQGIADRITADGGQVATLSIDVAQRNDLVRLVAFAEERFGRLDVLVSNAGVMPIGPLDDLAVDDWVRMVDVNLKGVLYGIAAALPVFRRQKHGHFINVASTAARKVTPNQAVYAATKAAVAALSEGLRQELAGELRVSVMFPGFVETNFSANVKDPKLKAELESAADRFAMKPESVATAIAYAIEQPDNVNIGEILIRSIAQP